MLGVLVLSDGPSDRMHGLDARTPASLLPLSDRPVLQHCVESLVSQGVTSIHLVVRDAPEKVEALLGDGRRWGCHFHYHLAHQPSHPYGLLQILPELGFEGFVLAHTDLFPSVPLRLEAGSISTIYMHQSSPTGEAVSTWGGMVIIPAGCSATAWAPLSSIELTEAIRSLLPEARVEVVPANFWIDARTPAGLLDTQDRMLNGQLTGLLMSGTERSPGVWIARNVVLDPSAELVGPLYIGPESRIGRFCRIGPNVVIGSECIVDSHTSVEHSLVLSGTYIGERLELNHCIATSSLLVDTRLDIGVSDLESFMIGGLEQGFLVGRLVQIAHSILALLLMIVLLPLELALAVYFLLSGQKVAYAEFVATPHQGSVARLPTRRLATFVSAGSPSADRAGWHMFARQVLPGLPAVVAGQLCLVGLPPQTVPEMATMPTELRSLWLQHRTGLISEACLAHTDRDDETQRQMVDRFYMAHQSVFYDLRLGFSFLGRLLGLD